VPLDLSSRLGYRGNLVRLRGFLPAVHVDSLSFACTFKFMIE
jgi:hypothetical protein